MRQGFTVWFTGMSGAGKTTLGQLLAAELKARGIQVECLDGDIMRQGLCRDLGFSVQDRERNIERVIFVAKLLNKHGVSVVASFITPYHQMRRLCREEIDRYFEVYVRCPFEVLLERDKKGLYKQALAGKITNFTGITDPFEEPDNPDLVVQSDQEEPAESLARIIKMLKIKGFLARNEGLIKRGVIIG